MTENYFLYENGIFRCSSPRHAGSMSVAFYGQARLVFSDSVSESLARKKKRKKSGAASHAAAEARTVARASHGASFFHGGVSRTAVVFGEIVGVVVFSGTDFSDFTRSCFAW